MGAKGYGFMERKIPQIVVAYAGSCHQCRNDCTLLGVKHGSLTANSF